MFRRPWDRVAETKARPSANYLPCVLRIILKGGRSDTQRLELDVDSAPEHLEQDGERYEPVLSHYDEHLATSPGAGGTG
ncbi:hypothetical protein GCM10009593_02870 [Microlunatus antarcticus]